MNFYAVIIGTEILNARREDKHFIFLRDELQKYGHTLFSAFIIKDDKELMKKTYELVKSDKDSVMFSFGGIGSTPDDLTRQISADIFTQKPLVRNQEFAQYIIERFADKAYPHRIHMSDLPENADLIHNPVNNMSGFSLDNRFFFVPGFPSMAHPMISQILKDDFSVSKKTYRHTLLAQTSEETLISLMLKVPSHVELSSLPMFKDSKPLVELSLSGKDIDDVTKYFNLFTKELQDIKIEYELI
jgi:molybdopterin-biosynthesis enzyme MoeA-like protein